MGKPPTVTIILGLSGVFINNIVYGAELYFARPLPRSERALKEVELAMHEAVNKVRATNGLKPLLWDDRLAAAALSHSEEMVAMSYFAHESPTPGNEDVTDRVYHAGLTDVEVAENLAAENNLPATLSVQELGEGLTDILMTSERHRENILDPRFTHEGIGCALTPEGTLLCTQLFSRRLINFKYIKLKEKTEEILRTTLILKTDDEVAVWVGDGVTLFKPAGGVVTVKLDFVLDDGVKKVVFAKRGAGSFGAMEAFSERLFDPRAIIPFSANITVVDVLAEEYVKSRQDFFILEAEGELDVPAEVKFTDGPFMRPVVNNARRFKISHKIPIGTGVHELYFVVGNTASHKVIVDSSAPLERAFW